MSQLGVLLLEAPRVRVPVARLEPRPLHPEGLVLTLELLHADDAVRNRQGRSRASRDLGRRRRRCRRRRHRSRCARRVQTLQVIHGDR